MPAILGGLVYWAIEGGTTLARSIAYGFWFAAALCLVAMALTSSKRVYRALPVAAFEGWVFTTSAVVLTLVGAGVDSLGAL